MRALSINQPWAWLIATGAKDCENRSWPTTFRGRFLIHAGKRLDLEAWRLVLMSRHPVTGCRQHFPNAGAADTMRGGGIIGEATLVNCVERSGSTWFQGKYGFMIEDAKLLPFRPCRGHLGFFTPTFEDLK